MPMPEALGRNGSYVVFRKLHQRVAAFRAYLNENSATPAEQELIAAKMMGRWRSGRSARAVSDARRPRARQRPEAEQRLPLRG